MTLYDLWISEGATPERALELLPPRAMPLPITERIRQMILHGQPLNQYHREKLENALRKHPWINKEIAREPFPLQGGRGAAEKKPAEQGTIAFISPVPGERFGPGDKTPPLGGLGATAIPKDHELYPVTRALLKEHSHYHALMVEEGLKENPDAKRLTELAGKVLTISGQIDAAYNKYRKEHS